MLKFMRKKTKSIVIYVLFALIILVFVFWGTGGLQTDKSNIIAAINGERILRSDFLKVYQNQIDLYRNLYKENFSRELLESLNLKERVLEGMIDNVLMLQEANRLNLKVSKEEIFNKIKGTPAFQQDGVFDKERYLRLLKNNRILPGEYEEELKGEILVEKLTNLISRHINVSDAEARDFFNYEEIKINLQYITVDSTDYKTLVSFTEDEAKDYFKKTTELFKIPDKLRFNYIILKSEDFKDETTTDEETEDTKKISIEKAKNKALDVLDRVFEEVISLKESAERDGLKVEDTGFLAKEEIRRFFIRERKVAEEALSLDVGKISKPIDGIEGVYVLEVVEKKEGYIPSYEEIAQQVKDTFTDEKAGEKALEASQGFLNEFKEGKDFLNLANDKNLKVLETGFFSKKNRFIPALGLTVREAVSIFSLTPKDPFTILTKGNKYFIVKLKDVQEPSEEEYNQMKDSIKQGLLSLKRDEALSGWIKSLRDKSEIETNRETL